jgi:2,3-bisphosphoglycerate-independent phosphoglycerate mutase
MPGAVLIFVDGLGVGRDDPAANPMARARGPLLSNFLGDPPGKPLPFRGAFAPLDACLGVEGIPQSATGQTSLLTGRNAQADLGRHLFGFPNERLRQILGESSILKRVQGAGRTARFANAFRPLFFELPKEAMIRRLSATTVATLAAGVPFFGLPDLRAGRSLYQDYTNAVLIERGFDVPRRTPEEAGRILAEMSGRFDFLLYEYFLTDKAGHGGDLAEAEACVRGLEAFLGAFLSAADLRDRLVALASDHGNLEDLSFKGHTRNPAQGLVFGPGAAEKAVRLRSILDVCPMLLGATGIAEKGA